MRSLIAGLVFLVAVHVAFLAGNAPVVVSVILAPFTMLVACTLIVEIRQEAKYRRVLKRWQRRYSRKAGMVV